jgi:2'-5' RNA ligase
LSRRFFIGVVPPDSYRARIMAFRQRWGAVRTDPHITVKAPGGLTADLAWLPRVEAACRLIPRFSVALGYPEMFGEDVVFLPAASSELRLLHRRLVEAVGAVPGPFELQGYHPHLTLGERDHGLSGADLQEIGRMAAAELHPYPSFQVTFVRIYSREDGDSAYWKLTDFPLLAK